MRCWFCVFWFFFFELQPAEWLTGQAGDAASKCIRTLAVISLVILEMQRTDCLGTFRIPFSSQKKLTCYHEGHSVAFTGSLLLLVPPLLVDFRGPCSELGCILSILQIPVLKSNPQDLRM